MRATTIFADKEQTIELNLDNDDQDAMRFTVREATFVGGAEKATEVG